MVLVIVDVFMAFLSPKLPANSDQDVRTALVPLGKMAGRVGCSVPALRHLNKRSGDSAMYRGGGSIGIVGAARVGLLSGYHPDDAELDDVNARRKVLSVPKCNVGRYEPTLAYRTYEHDTGSVAVEWLGEAAGVTAETPAIGQ